MSNLFNTPSPRVRMPLSVDRPGSLRGLFPMLAGSLVVLAMLLPLVSGAQNAAAPPRPAHKTVHHRAAVKPAGTPAAAKPEIVLPASIPATTGPIESLYALRYVDIKVGTGAVAMPGQRYTVHYTGWLYDGTKFDSSVDRNQPFDFTQGRQSVIIGWDTGFEGMKVGGKRRLFVPWQLAYGAAGRDPIPPKGNLIFDVELLALDGVGATPPQ